MSAGKLDRRVQFLRLVPGNDGYGNVVEAWANHGSPVWASKKPLSVSEQLRAEQVGSHITTRFVVRYSAFTAGITAVDRFTSQDVLYRIVGIKEKDRMAYLEIDAEARTDDTTGDLVIGPDPQDW